MTEHLSKVVKRLSLVVGVVLVLGTTPAAMAADCTLGANVLTLGACTFGSLTFADWAVSPAGLDSASIFFGAGSNVTGDWVNVQFQVTHAPSPTTGQADILLKYTVAGGIFGVDMSLGTRSGSITITENVCDNGFNGGTCHSLVVSTNNPPGPTGEISFPTLGKAWISKDIQLQQGATLSDFTNSHHIPEPLTSLLVGSALLGLGLLRRKALKN